MKGLLISPDETVKPVDIADYDHLHEVVGGFYELVSFTERADAFVDEDGKSKRLPVNHLATFLTGRFQIGLRPDDYIVGPLVLLGPPDDEGDSTDLPDDFSAEVLTAIAEYARRK